MTATAPDSAITLRPLEPRDAQAAAALCHQLGYERTPEQILEWLGYAATQPQREVAFVACLADEVVGWIQLAVIHHLQSAPHVVIAGLVVKDTIRGAGIGRTLCEQTEAWTRQLGLDTIRLTSRSTRLDAHRFYLREGYRQIKLSLVFEKTLAPTPAGPTHDLRK